MSARARPGLALVALGAIIAVSVSWWALALVPISGPAPEWVLRPRLACFGAGPEGLPNAGGWLLLVGEPGRGSAHLLDAATGALLATFTGAGDFGRSVALGNGSACVGAPSRGDVTVSDAATGDRLRVLSRPGAFGSALAFVGGRLLGGAPQAGRAYLLDPADSSEIAALSGKSDFGAAVAGADGLCLVAAPAARRAFLHDDMGALVRTFVAPGFAESFGTGVAYDDAGHVVVGGVAGGLPSLFVFDSATGALARTIQSSSPNEGLSLAALSGGSGVLPACAN